MGLIDVACIPFLAMAFVDFAPAFLFEDPVILTTMQLAVFVLAVLDQSAAALGALVWLAHGMALRIRLTNLPALTQRRNGQARVPAPRAAGGMRVPVP